MKLLRLTLALTLVASLAVSAFSQVGYRGRNIVPNTGNPQALAALQQDLISAIEQMKSALPIYDGNRVKSIHAAHAALLVVDNAIYGTRNAPVRKKPDVKDQIASGTAKTKYTATQIAASQATMRKAYATLEQAYKDLQAAAGANPNAKAVKVNTHLQTAGTEAKTAIALHSTLG